MNYTKISKILITLFAVLFCCGTVGSAGPLGSAFTYQGRLFDNNYPADGPYDLKFRLYDSLSDGNPIGDEVSRPNTPVNDGYFTVELDFGNVFDGNDRWLEISVRLSGDINDPNVLSPRQKVTPAPYSLFAKIAGYAQTTGSAAGGITGSGTANYIAKFTGPNSIGNSIIYEQNGNIGIGTTSPTATLDVNGNINIRGNAFVGDGSGLTNLPCGVPSGVIVMWSGSIANIPSGWALCDGTNGTPNLKDRFIFGAGNLAAPGDNRTVGNRMSLTGTGSAISMMVTGVGHRAEGGQSVAETNTDYMPPYYALAYIMKL